MYLSSSVYNVSVYQETCPCDVHPIKKSLSCSENGVSGIYRDLIFAQNI